MTAIASFTFNPFQENTYVLYDETGECVIIDPGCFNKKEEQQLTDFIASKNLKPVQLLLTHSHVDHIMGNAFIHEKFGLKPILHRDEEAQLQAGPMYAQMFGVTLNPSPSPAGYLEEGDTVRFGNTELEVIFTPGHSPGEISFFCRKENFLIAGDVLFLGSIGRTDLPGGDYDLLIKTIKEKFFPLGDTVKVYPGHGPETNIGYEKKSNPFLIR